MGKDIARRKGTSRSYKACFTRDIMQHVTSPYLVSRRTRSECSPDSYEIGLASPADTINHVRRLRPRVPSDTLHIGITSEEKQADMASP
jgi:hypothetical protein